ncbi:hypothetical protein BDA99DRAFT_41784 [Phascolomyces articulosus]|uniref:Uncharacterized protein n=1 Tax=Phascolomyces articulosus TaxID=60185 RepID=A0AAD5PEV3_9FUNG|nr:hypothetical protein BDA99DRAFT_41784 [Phascolomyces articulosus]
MQFVRDSCPSYYNWVIVDLCRRMNLIEYHFRKIYNENYEEKIRRKVLDSLANEIQSGHIDKYNSFGHTKDDEYFDYFTCFIPKKRTRVLRITRIFGDEICLFTEFIDFKAIGDMKHDEFIAFYHDLLLCKDRLKECLAKVREDVKKVFQGDPTEPYKRVDVLNHEI